MWIDGGGKGCIEFLPQSIERSLPKPKQETENAPRGGIGYFNYDIGDNKFGPINGWGEVTGNPEQLRYQELLGTLKRSLVNKCNWKYINQSPIDLCESKINKDCQEYHQTRTHVRMFQCLVLLLRAFSSTIVSTNGCIFMYFERVGILTCQINKSRLKFFLGKKLSILKCILAYFNFYFVQYTSLIIFSVN